MYLILKVTKFPWSRYRFVKINQIINCIMRILENREIVFTKCSASKPTWEISHEDDISSVRPRVDFLLNIGHESPPLCKIIK